MDNPPSWILMRILLTQRRRQWWSLLIACCHHGADNSSIPVWMMKMSWFLTGSPSWTVVSLLLNLSSTTLAVTTLIWINLGRCFDNLTFFAVVHRYLSWLHSNFLRNKSSQLWEKKFKCSKLFVCSIPEVRNIRGYNTIFLSLQRNVAVEVFQETWVWRATKDAQSRTTAGPDIKPFLALQVL